MIILNEKVDSVWLQIYDKIVVVLESVKRHCHNLKKKFFVLKEKLPNQAGRFTTIASLQGLAQVHAIWELACGKSDVEVIEKIQENSIGYVKQLEQLTNFRRKDGKQVFIFITKVKKEKE